MLKRSVTWRWVALTSLAIGMLGLNLTPSASAANHNNKDIEHVQRTLTDKGFDPGNIDGIMGPHTRSGIREFQKSEDMPVTGRLDAATAAKLGVGPESIGGNFKAAGREVGGGGKEFGHEITEGKPLAAGKELGKGIGRAAQSVGKGVVGAVSTDSDRGDREKAKPQPKQ